MGGRRSSGGTERVHRRARTHGGKGEWKAGAFQWGGLNEDAADYPIRKFSLHFDRARRAASNKNYSVLYAIRFPLLRYPPFFLLSTCRSFSSNLFSLAKNVDKGDRDSGKNRRKSTHLISTISKEGRCFSLWNTSSSIFEKDISKCAEKWKRRDERVGLMNFFFSAVLFLTAKVDRYFRPIP